MTNIPLFLLRFSIPGSAPVDVEKFDAILFDPRDISLSDVPLSRLARQYYVYWNVEAPVWLWLDNTDLGDLQNFFNWSMGYRQDADFPVPYGALEQVTQDHNFSGCFNVSCNKFECQCGC